MLLITTFFSSFSSSFYLLFLFLSSSFSFSSSSSLSLSTSLSTSSSFSPSLLPLHPLSLPLYLLLLPLPLSSPNIHSSRAGHQAKGEDIARGSDDRSHSELRRQYHCAAYNMVASVISCTQSDVKFYTAFLFKEDLAKVKNTSLTPL